MRLHNWGAVLAAGLLVVVLLGVGVPGLIAPGGDAYDWTEVHVHDTNGSQLASVDVRIADTPRLRYVGLSETDTLGPDEGMLFVHETSGEHTYVMRGMDFPLDIVFIDRNGTITTIHHAPVSDGLTRDRYSGEGKYVLEVRAGYTNDSAIDVGDRVEIEGYPPGEP